MTALHMLLCGQGPPYLDLPVWGPFGGRISKSVKLMGMTINTDGQLTPMQLYGPSTSAARDQPTMCSAWAQ